MWDLLSSCNYSYLVQSPNLWRKTAVDTEHFAVNDRSKRKEVENLAARLPDTCVAVFLLTFFVESVYLRDLARLMVSSHKCDLVRVSVIVSARR